MKLILTDNTEFALEHINVMMARQEESEDGTMPPDSKRIDLVFDDSVAFDDVAAADRSLFGSITVQTADGSRVYTGYAFDSLSQHISDHGARMTLALSKQ